MKTYKVVSVFFLNVVLLLPLIAHADTRPGLQDAYQPAKVVSVRKMPTPANYVYEIGFQLNCTLYTVRYKSAYDAVVPQALTPNSNVNVRLAKNWLNVDIEPERHLEMRVLNTTKLSADACPPNRTSASTPGTVPAGTILPITLNTALRSDKNRSGDPVIATVMQDIALDNGITLPKGSKVIGHVLKTDHPASGGGEASISFLFDQLKADARTIPVTTNLRALASPMAISATRTPRSNNDDSSTWTYMQIGGDQVSYGQDGPVALGSEVVGKSTSQGTVAYLTADLGTECRSAIEGNDRPQSFWVFSSHACGIYSLGDVKILHAGRTDPVGQITLVSDGKNVNVSRGSGMLLRVDRAASQTAYSPAQTSSR